MNVLLGVTGSIAAVLTHKLVAALKVAGHEVEVVGTDPGLYFVPEGKVEARIWSDKAEWPEGGYERETPIAHIDLGKWADVALIAPLTANTLADLATGRCDKLLTCLMRAWPLEKPVVVAPAMNTNMWTHPATKLHLDTLSDWYRLTIVWPVEKRLACGDIGLGAMAEISTIVQALESLS